MTTRKTRHLKLWVAMLFVTAALILGHGFYRDLSANNEETYKGLKLFSDVIEIVQKNYVDEVDTQKMIEAAIQGMVHSLDPHSSLLPPDALKELQIDTHGEFTGIGIHVTMRNNLVTVISPIEGTPAYRAGIKAGDKIRIDAPARTLDLLVDEAELARRKSEMPAFEPKVKHGWLARYSMHVLSADRGAVMDI